MKKNYQKPELQEVHLALGVICSSTGNTVDQVIIDAEETWNIKN